MEQAIIQFEVPVTCNIVAVLNDNLTYSCYQRIGVGDFKRVGSLDYKAFGVFLNMAADLFTYTRALIHIQGKITLAQLREQAGLSLKEVALSGGIDYRTLKAWEVDSRKADTYKLFKILKDVYDCPLELLHIGQAEERAM